MPDVVEQPPLVLSRSPVRTRLRLSTLAASALTQQHQNLARRKRALAKEIHTLESTLRKRNLEQAALFSELQLVQTRINDDERRIHILSRLINLANKIRELEAVLIQQRKALAALTIEVDLALSRREDEHDRYETLKEEKNKLRYTIHENFNQSDLGMEYQALQKRYYDYVNNKDDDTDINYFNNLKPRFDYVSSIFKELMKSGMASIIAKKIPARKIYMEAGKHHYALYQQQQDLKGIISNLERELERALIRDRELNQAHGKKRQRHFTHKKGKKVKK